MSSTPDGVAGSEVHLSSASEARGRMPGYRRPKYRIRSERQRDGRRSKKAGSSGRTILDGPSRLVGPGTSVAVSAGDRDGPGGQGGSLSPGLGSLSSVSVESGSEVEVVGFDARPSGGGASVLFGGGLGGGSKGKGKGKGKRSKAKRGRKKRHGSRRRSGRSGGYYSSSIASSSSSSSSSAGPGRPRDYAASLIHAYGAVSGHGMWNRNFVKDRKFHRKMDSLRNVPKRHIIEYIDYEDVSAAEFTERYARPVRPVMVRGAMRDWPANRRWTMERFGRDYPHNKVNVGNSSARISMRHYVKYVDEDAHGDDNPLYLFEANLERNLPGVLRDYTIPDYFDQDMFTLLPRGKRPPWRWLVIGPRRSGSEAHQDPNGSSAWNALISGRKRWCLWPPETNPKDIFLDNRKKLGSDEDAIHWWKDCYHRLKVQPAFECIQEAGEIIYVPANWWHTVLNLDLAIAVTENAAVPAQAKIVKKALFKARPRFARRFMKVIKRERPEAFQEAQSGSYSVGSSWSTSSSGWTEVDGWSK